MSEIVKVEGQRPEPLTMTSLEIAELTGKRHDNVMRDIRKMLSNIERDDPSLLLFEDHPLKFECMIEVPIGKGATRRDPALRLTRNLTITLVSKYSDAMHFRIVRRWQELEAKNAPAPALSIMEQLQDPVARARFALEAIETIGQLKEENAELVRTKSQIASKQQATALQTASAKARSNSVKESHLKLFELTTGIPRGYMTAGRIPWLKLYFKDASSTTLHQRVSLHLGAIARKRGYPIKKRNGDDHYGINLYHVSTVNELRDDLENGRTPYLEKYRHHRPIPKEKVAELFLSEAGAETTTVPVVFTQPEQPTTLLPEVHHPDSKPVIVKDNDPYHVPIG